MGLNQGAYNLIKAYYPYIAMKTWIQVVFFRINFHTDFAIKMFLHYMGDWTILQISNSNLKSKIPMLEGKQLELIFSCQSKDTMPKVNKIWLTSDEHHRISQVIYIVST